MESTISPITATVFGGAGLALLVGASAYRRRPEPLAGSVALLMFAVAAWAVPHGISLQLVDVEWVALLHRLRYLGTVAAPVIYLVIAARYAGHDGWLSRATLAGLAAIPVLTLLVVWTNPYHGLFWRSLAIERAYGASVFVPTYGPWFWINLGYLYLVTAAGLVLLARVVVAAGPIYRKEATLMFLGGLLPLGVNVVVHLSGWLDPPVDLTTTALAVSGALFAIALFHLDLLEIQPVVRERLFAELDDGVVVVGPDGRIRDFNPAAASILDGLERGRSAEGILAGPLATDGGEIVRVADGERGYFRVRSTRLRDGRGRAAGRIVYLNDVTDIVDREQRISVLNRVLRHNVRNELTIVDGHLASLAGAVDDRRRPDVERARESARRIIDYAEKGRLLERTLRAEGGHEVVPIVPAVDRVLEEQREAHPNATLTVSAPGSGTGDTLARTADERLFRVALGEVIENAVVHNDRERPRVDVRVSMADDRSGSTSRTTGPGSPRARSRRCRTGARTPSSTGAASASGWYGGSPRPPTASCRSRNARIAGPSCRSPCPRSARMAGDGRPHPVVARHGMTFRKTRRKFPWVMFSTSWSS